MLTKKEYLLYCIVSTSLILIFSPIKLYSQNFAIRNYSLIDGLPESRVKTLCEDKFGYLWLGTQGGVARFDGFNFEVFSTQHGLLSNNINYIFSDNKEEIWVATRFGVALWQGNSFKVLTEKDGLVHNDVKYIFQDKKGNYWFGTASGISQYDGKNFKNFQQKEGLTGITWSIDEDKSGNIWVATSNGLYKISEGKITNYTTENGLPSDYINTIHIDNKNRVWIGTDAGLSKFENNKFTNFNTENAFPFQNVLLITDTKSKKNSTDSFSYLKNIENSIWIGTGSGAYRWNGDKNKIEISITENNGLLSPTITSILSDEYGVLWIATEGGLSKIGGQTFQIYNKNYFGISGSIWAVLSDNKNNIWFGTDGEGVIQFTDDNFERRITIDDGLAGNYVKSIFEDKQGNIWFGTFEGVSKFTNGNFTNYNIEDGLADNYVYSIIQDDKNNIWFATNAGISRFDGESFQNFNQQKDKIAHDFVRVAYQDKKNNLWFGTYGGVTQYDGKKFINYTTENGLAHNLVLAILEDSKGKLWFATENGLCKLKDNAKSSNKDCFTCYGEKEGLKSQNIWLLSEDNQGNIWIGHRNGVERFDPTEVKFSYFGYLEGFQLIQTFPNAVSKDKKGNLWFGALNGVVKYDPSKIKKNQIPPKVYLNALKVNNKPIDWEKMDLEKDADFDIPVWGEKKIKFNYDQNNLTFSFVGLHSAIPEDIKYRYKLEGFDEEWSDFTNQSTITYTNLKPGRYVFLVKSYDYEGVESKEPAKLEFIIDSPYWEKWWFYSIQILLFFLLIGASVYFNTRLRSSRITIILTFLTLLVVFEFVNVYLENFLDNYIHNVPLYKTLINVIVAVSFTPIEAVMRKYFQRVSDKLHHIEEN